MTGILSNTVVESVIKGEPRGDTQAKIGELEKQLAKVRADITEQEQLEKRWAVLQSGFAKLRRELTKTLTPEEYQALNGAYIFLHSGSVDLVRTIPSSTDRGEGERFVRFLDDAILLDELKALDELK